MEKISRIDLIDKALMVSDNIALLHKESSSNKIEILAISMARTKSRAIISLCNELHDLKVVKYNMSENMLKRAVDAVKRNREQLIEEIQEKR